MFAFLVIFSAALLGYFRAPALAWPAAALSLLLVSWAEHYLLARRGVEAGLGNEVTDALLRSTANALIATGLCYWSGVLIRSLSGL
jgi:hypothetical protein